MNTDKSSIADRAEQVLQESWQERQSGKKLSVLGVHVIAAVGFAVAALALLLLAPGQREASPVLALALVAAYVVGGRVLIAVGAGYAVPTQIALVPMLVVLPPAMVPPLVAAGLVLAAAWDDARANGRVRLRPLLVAVGDAPYALAPALVFVALGAPDAGAALLIACALAAVAQCALDYGVSAARERAIRGLRPQQQLAVMAQVWTVDVLLWPIGVVVAGAVAASPWSVLALWPILVLLDRLVRERNARLEQAQARLGELALERQRLADAVRRVGQAFGAHDLDAVMTTTLETAADATGADGGSFAIERDDRNARLVELSTTPHTAADAHVEFASGDGVRGDIVLRRRSGALTDQEIALVRFLGEQALVAEAQIERSRRLHEEAQTDELTGLANYRRLQRALDDGVEAHGRDGALMSLILLDLDRFKAVNDTYGHGAGDLVLQTLGFCLRDNARLGDLPARQGGEELALVLPNTGTRGAVGVAERLAATIRRRTIPVSPDEAITVTASFGVATLGVHASDKAGLLQAADAALYTAKAGGRDRVCAADMALALERL